MNDEIITNIQQLIKDQQSLFLSTLNELGEPAASYTPYYCDEKENVFYIFISDLSSHTKQLINNPKASILIARDEQQTQQIFARNRVTYSVTAEQIEDTTQKQQILEQMQQQFGEIIELLSGLSDFRLFKLQAENGRYVEGFGKAFDIGQGIAEEIKPAMSQNKQ